MIDSHALKEKEFGWFLHGPLYLEKDIASGEFPPPVQFSSTTQKKIFRLDSIDTNNSDMWSGKLKVLGEPLHHLHCTRWKMAKMANRLAF